MMRTLTVALLLASAACGGKDKAPATTTAAHEHHEGGEGSGGGGMEHENLSPELEAFHDLLAPKWHADKGPKRIADTCGAIEQFKVAADTVGKATPPVPANADTWTTGTRALVAAVAELETACKAKNDAGFEAAFPKVHDGFHVLMEQGEHSGSGDAKGSGGEHHAK